MKLKYREPTKKSKGGNAPKNSRAENKDVKVNKGHNSQNKQEAAMKTMCDVNTPVCVQKARVGDV